MPCTVGIYAAPPKILTEKFNLPLDSTTFPSSVSTVQCSVRGWFESGHFGIKLSRAPVANVGGLAVVWDTDTYADFTTTGAALVVSPPAQYPFALSHQFTIHGLVVGNAAATAESRALLSIGLWDHAGGLVLRADGLHWSGDYIPMPDFAGDGVWTYVALVLRQGIVSLYTATSAGAAPTLVYQGPATAAQLRQPVNLLRESVYIGNNPSFTESWQGYLKDVSVHAIAPPSTDTVPFVIPGASHTPSWPVVDTVTRFNFTAANDSLPFPRDESALHSKAQAPTDGRTLSVGA
jgi:hypothetical protein